MRRAGGFSPDAAGLSRPLRLRSSRWRASGVAVQAGAGPHRHRAP